MLEARIAHCTHCASGGGGSSSTAAAWNTGFRPQLSVGLALEMPDGTETTITVRPPFPPPDPTPTYHPPTPPTHLPTTPLSPDRPPPPELTGPTLRLGLAGAQHG